MSHTLVGALPFIGSSSLSVAVAATQEASAHGGVLASRSTIHRSFERFQAIDLSFRLAVAPRLGDRILHRVDVSLHRASETLMRDFRASLSQPPSLPTLLPLSMPLNRMASRRIVANSGQSFFIASTFAA
jgi:hypothetical protein